jgi:protein SCO1/2
VVTVSFDPRETPALASAKKAAYLEGYGRPEGASGWHFLTGEAREILRVTGAVGFGFEYDPKTDQFSHASTLIILTPGGRVSRYFYGIEFSPRDLRLGLVEAAEGRIGNLADQVLLYCFHYDPETGRYSVAILNTIRLLGVVTVIALFAFLLWNFRRDRWRRAVV